MAKNKRGVFMIEENLFEKAKRFYENGKNILTDEEVEVIEWLNEEVLSFASIGYGSIRRSFKFRDEDHSLLYAKRIALHYEQEGFTVELSKEPFGHFLIVISWAK